MWTESHYDNKLLTSQQHHYDAEKLSHHGYASVVDKATESHGNAHDQTTAIFDMDLKEIKKEGKQILYDLLIFNILIKSYLIFQVHPCYHKTNAHNSRKSTFARQQYKTVIFSLDLSVLSFRYIY